MLKEVTLYQLSGSQIQKLIVNKKIQAKEVVKAFGQRITEVDKKVNALITNSEELAYAQAAIIDEKVNLGEPLPPLAGVPLVIKDNIALQGLPLTCASKILKNFIAPYTATVCSRLNQAGALFLGKTNMDEFAMGSSSENSAFFRTKNPHNLACSPGGSSGGTAAAVAVGEAPIGLGSDTGGSVRQPASFCGITSLKPSYGRISRYGLVGFASSLDQIGPMARNIKDLALLLQVLAGPDEADGTTSLQAPPSYTKNLEKGVKGLRIGLPKEYFNLGVDSLLKDQILDIVSVLEKEGALVEDCSLPSTEYGLLVYQIISSAEASSNLARIDGIRYGVRSSGNLAWDQLMAKTREEGIGNEVKRRMLLGAYFLQEKQYQDYFVKAQKLRTQITREFVDIFSRFDALITPTTGSVFSFDSKEDIYKSDILTVSANLAGVPALSLPCGRDKSSLPWSLQIIGNHFSEDKVLQLAQAVENIVDWPKDPVELREEVNTSNDTI